MLRRSTTTKFNRLQALRHIALATCLATAACGGEGATGAPQTDTGSIVEPAGPDPVVVTPAPTPTPPRASKANVGINVAGTSYWSGERSFANLASGGNWTDPGTAGWGALDPSQIDENGTVKSLNAGQKAAINLARPAEQMQGKDVRIRCTYSGEGSLSYDGFYPRPMEIIQNGIEFTWIATATKTFLYLNKTNPENPLRNLDCREADMDRNLLFAPEFIESLRPFQVLRFLDWMPANTNPAVVNWSIRTLPSNVSQTGAQGVAIEHMIDLANQTQTDPWFTIPWNADETYIRNFATLVRDRLSPDRKVYVELTNEMWNAAFPVFNQILAEAVAANLATDKYQGLLYRYAQKSAWALKIWTEVFAANPDRLVRVVATQHDNPWQAGEVLGFGDTAQYVDALATAPYFGHDLLAGANAAETDLNKLFALLAAQAKNVMADKTSENKAAATKYRKRYITYEAGQHIVAPGNQPTLAALNRDQRMYDIYKTYMADWKSNSGDLMVMFSATGGISQYGAWGIREYAGQPLSETPKRRAVLDFLAGK
ncbi:hypothetical protein [Sphingobium boeckii]|uniref:Cellulose-binding protein n=1 Tax=Sphingobium boeckii TaxID=1082345 RepID=A0A7W9EFJ1_9SPHN|nr:hypothetical protein [Sphingobium boeckii]MBB5687154.1 hypothetical protein [Sphingobium boeckii]